MGIGNTGVDLSSMNLQQIKDYLHSTDAEYRRSSASVKRNVYGRWQAEAALAEAEIARRELETMMSRNR
jgi:hypothetical protein|tara:strand:+ start:1047 stop:1253 length:207 start_codon:yes stop_codon:yes gene_type:complete